MAERNPNTEQCSDPLPLIARQFFLNPTRVEIHKQRDLCRVERRNGKYGGYRKDILTEKLTDRDEVFLICDICKGIMREPCFTSSGEQFCSCCEILSHSKQTPNEVVRKMVNLLKCCCPLLERGCEWLGTLRDCEEHLETCDYVRDQCRLGCGTVLQRNKLRAHEAEKCPCRKVECEHCNKYFTFCDMTTHHKECPKMELSCELKCGVVMCREDMIQHLEWECGLMVETCELGCDKEMTRSELRIHVTDTCVQRLIQCEHCTEDIKFCNTTTHFDVCSKKKLSCELACGVVMCREDMAQHLEVECVEKVIMCPFVKYNCEVTSIKRKYLSQHLEEKESKHLGLKLNAMEDILLNQSEEVIREESEQYREESKQHREEIKQYMEEANQHREESKQHREEIKQYMEEANQHREENKQHREENKQHREENKQHREEIKQYMEEANQHREENKQHREEIKQFMEEANQHREENNQHREEIKQYMEEANQQRKFIDNQIIRINRISEHINALSSISDTTKLDWNIENLSKFIQINHIPEQRNIAGRDLSIHFLKEHIYVSYDDTYEYSYTFPAKYLIRLYSTIRCKVVKQYDCGIVDVYGMSCIFEYEKSQIARISESDAKELSLTGSANKLILEMYITEL